MIVRDEGEVETRRGRRTAIVVGLLALGAVVAGYAALRGDADGGPGGPAAGTDRSTGSARWLEISAPSVRHATLGGDSASLAGMGDTLVVLNFWATWCAPCIREIPDLVRLRDSLSREPVQVVGLAVETATRSELRRFVEEHGITYPVWITDPETAASAYEIVGLPVTLLVDRDGVIRQRYLGAQRFDRLYAAVRALLAGDPPPSAPASGTS